MRVLLLAGMATLFLASAPATYARTNQGSLRNCAPLGSVVLASNRHAEVFRYRFGAYGCIRRSGHVVYLGYPEGHHESTPECFDDEQRCSLVSQETLAGDVVAYQEGRLGDITKIVVRSIATDRVLHDVTLAVESSRQVLVELAQPLRILVKSDGAVAWIQQESFGRHDGGTAPPTAYDVYAVDRHGFRPLSTDLPTQPLMMKLVGSTLSWTQGKTRESAVLD